MATIVAKWQRNAGAAGPAYADGIQGRGGDWEGAAGAAEASYSQGVQAAISRNAFSAGVRRAGGAKWEQKSRTIGADRYAPGVAASGSEYQQGFAPYHAVISGVSLPPKGPRGSEQNYQRVVAVGRALHRARLGQA